MGNQRMCATAFANVRYLLVNISSPETVANLLEQDLGFGESVCSISTANSLLDEYFRDNFFLSQEKCEDKIQ